MLTGKVEEEGGGTPIKEYWEGWKLGEGVWTHDDVLPSITIGKDGGGLCSFIKRKPCKVRSRTLRQDITSWLQVNGRRAKYAIQVRFPYAMKDAIRAACEEITGKFENS